MKNFFVFFGFLMTGIFGGGFLIRLIRDSNFYIAESIVGIIGMVILIIGLFFRRRTIPDN
ncbi:Uncharacterised protein [Lysinibacillus sphaericus]|nr:Uncharacterised protein [Lysinibacillus sphaericus]